MIEDVEMTYNLMETRQNL